MLDLLTSSTDWINEKNYYDSLPVSFADLKVVMPLIWRSSSQYVRNNLLTAICAHPYIKGLFAIAPSYIGEDASLAQFSKAFKSFQGLIPSINYAQDPLSFTKHFALFVRMNTAREIGRIGPNPQNAPLALSKEEIINMINHFHKTIEDRNAVTTTDMRLIRQYSNFKWGDNDVMELIYSINTKDTGRVITMLTSPVNYRLSTVFYNYVICVLAFDPYAQLPNLYYDIVCRLYNITILRLWEEEENVLPTLHYQLNTPSGGLDQAVTLKRLKENTSDMHLPMLGFACIASKEEYDNCVSPLYPEWDNDITFDNTPEVSGALKLLILSNITPRFNSVFPTVVKNQPGDIVDPIPILDNNTIVRHGMREYRALFSIYNQPEFEREQVSTIRWLAIMKLLRFMVLRKEVMEANNNPVNEAILRKHLIENADSFYYFPLKDETYTDLSKPDEISIAEPFGDLWRPPQRITRSRGELSAAETKKEREIHFLTDDKEYHVSGALILQKKTVLYLTTSVPSEVALYNISNNDPNYITLQKNTYDYIKKTPELITKYTSDVPYPVDNEGYPVRVFRRDLQKTHQLISRPPAPRLPQPEEEMAYPGQDFSLFDVGQNEAPSEQVGGEEVDIQISEEQVEAELENAWEDSIDNASQNPNETFQDVTGSDDTIVVARRNNQQDISDVEEISFEDKRDEPIQADLEPETEESSETTQLKAVLENTSDLLKALDDTYAALETENVMSRKPRLQSNINAIKNQIVENIRKAERLENTIAQQHGTPANIPFQTIMSRYPTNLNNSAQIFMLGPIIQEYENRKQTDTSSSDDSIPGILGNTTEVIAWARQKEIEQATTFPSLLGNTTEVLLELRRQELENDTRRFRPQVMEQASVILESIQDKAANGTLAVPPDILEKTSRILKAIEDNSSLEQQAPYPASPVPEGDTVILPGLGLNATTIVFTPKQPEPNTTTLFNSIERQEFKDIVADRQRQQRRSPFPTTPVPPNKATVIEPSSRRVLFPPDVTANVTVPSPPSVIQNTVSAIEGTIDSLTKTPRQLIRLVTGDPNPSSTTPPAAPVTSVIAIPLALMDDFGSLLLNILQGNIPFIETYKPLLYKYKAVYYSSGWLIIQYDSLYYNLQLAPNNRPAPEVPVSAIILWEQLMTLFGFNNEVKQLYDGFVDYFKSDSHGEYVLGLGFFGAFNQYVDFIPGSYVADTGITRLPSQFTQVINDYIRTAIPGLFNLLTGPPSPVTTLTKKQINDARVERTDILANNLKHNQSFFVADNPAFRPSYIPPRAPQSTPISSNLSSLPPPSEQTIPMGDTSSISDVSVLATSDEIEYRLQGISALTSENESYRKEVRRAFDEFNDIDYYRLKDINQSRMDKYNKLIELNVAKMNEMLDELGPLYIKKYNLTPSSTQEDAELASKHVELDLLNNEIHRIERRLIIERVMEQKMFGEKPFYTQDPLYKYTKQTVADLEEKLAESERKRARTISEINKIEFKKEQRKLQGVNREKIDEIRNQTVDTLTRISRRMPDNTEAILDKMLEERKLIDAVAEQQGDFEGPGESEVLQGDNNPEKDEIEDLLQPYTDTTPITHTMQELSGPPADQLATRRLQLKDALHRLDKLQNALDSSYESIGSVTPSKKIRLPSNTAELNRDIEKEENFIFQLRGDIEKLEKLIASRGDPEIKEEIQETPAKILIEEEEKEEDEEEAVRDEIQELPADVLVEEEIIVEGTNEEIQTPQEAQVPSDMTQSNITDSFLDEI